MPDATSPNLSGQLIRFYINYRDEYERTPQGPLMEYGWWSFPESINIVWLTYDQMLFEYAAELANIINQLTLHVRRLRAWDKLLTTASDAEKLEVATEFVDTLGAVGLGLPYAIKSRFAFAAGHLSHQANWAADGRNWKDDFPTSNLYLNDIEPYCAKWRKFRKFKIKVESIAGKKFKAETRDYRNSYNHGFSTRLLIGITGSVQRTIKDGRVTYSIGGNSPLTLAAVADLLEVEARHCHMAFEAFQHLVREQIETIVAVDSGGSAKAGGRVV